MDWTETTLQCLVNAPTEQLLEHQAELLKIAILTALTKQLAKAA